MHANRFAARHFGGLAGSGVVVLAVQARCGLVRHQVQREPVAAGSAQAFEGLHPRRVRRAVVVAVAGDGLAPQLDLPARRAQRLSRRVGTEGLQEHLAGFPHRRHARCHHVAAAQELVIWRGLGIRRPVNLVDHLEPLVCSAAFGELLPEVQPLGEAGEDPVVVAGLPHGLRHRRHRDDHRLGATDVVSFQGCGCRQHDVGTAGHRRPKGLVDDDRLGSLPRPHQPVQVLVVVEGVAARPVDELDVGEPAAVPVEVERLTGPFEHLGDA